jgi:hypothetical protein
MKLTGYVICSKDRRVEASSPTMMSLTAYNCFRKGKIKSNQKSCILNDFFYNPPIIPAWMDSKRTISPNISSARNMGRPTIEGN